MKHLIIFVFFLLCLTSCSPNTKMPAVLKQPLPLPAHIQNPEKTRQAQRGYGKIISDVGISTVSFNPKKDEETAIYFRLMRKAAIELNIYDPDFVLVRTIISNGILEAGRQTLIWDGRDMDGSIVPDEAYFFTVEARDEKGGTEIYDPTDFSGGEADDITEADVNPETKIITYSLPAAARVLIRIGVQDGPLLNTLVDWKPRVAGEITEYWNGKDKDNLIDLFEHPRCKLIISYFVLPENSVITYGNGLTSYREYKDSSKTQRPVKQRPERKDRKISPHYLLARTVDYSPALALTFSDIKEYDNGIPVLQGKTLVKVEIDEKDPSFFVSQQYEICLFLNTEFHSEQEKGYVPFNWVWDFSDMKEGEYIFTVNVAGFKDQIGVLSRKIRVKK